MGITLLRQWHQSLTQSRSLCSTLASPCFLCPDFRWRQIRRPVHHGGLRAGEPAVVLWPPAAAQRHHRSVASNSSDSPLSPASAGKFTGRKCLNHCSFAYTYLYFSLTVSNMNCIEKPLSVPSYGKWTASSGLPVCFKHSRTFPTLKLLQFWGSASHSRILRYVGCTGLQSNPGPSHPPMTTLPLSHCRPHTINSAFSGTGSCRILSVL